MTLNTPPLISGRAKTPIARLESVELRHAWDSEASDFTPWLAAPENLKLLGEAIGMDLDLATIEIRVGPFRADIVAEDSATHTKVLIENQLERTDHSHLGQLLTYAAGLEGDDVTIVWVAQRFCDEHRAAMDWLNEVTSEHVQLFGLEIELWRIGDSPVAPKFNVVSRPNDWSRLVRGTTGGELTEGRALQLEYWTAFKELMEARNSLKVGKPQSANWMTYGVGGGGAQLVSVASLKDSVTDTFGGELRVEFVLSGPNGKTTFGILERQRAEIERQLELTLLWDNNPEKKQSKVYVRRPARLEERSEWPEQHDWLRTNLELFHRVFSKWVRELP